MAAGLDLGAQINYVKESLGLGGESKKYKKGNGWDGKYQFYCVKCFNEIQEAFVDEKDPKQIKRCPECKESNELWLPEDRKNQLQLHIDQLYHEEKTYKSRRKKWKKFRKKHPLNDDEKELVYKEHEMWIAKVDLDEYLDNEFYVPRSIKEVTDLAWKLHAKYAICKTQMDKAIAVKIEFHLHFGNAHKTHTTYK